MTNPLLETFQKFIAPFESLKQSLAPPAEPSRVASVEKEIGLPLPKDLKNLYQIANGQKDFLGKGLFKLVSGFDIYVRPFFIPVESLSHYFQLISVDEELRREFKNDLLPFAVESEDRLGYCYAQSLSTGKIYALWTDYSQAYLDPPEWHIMQFLRADNMEGFLKYQYGLLF